MDPEILCIPPYHAQYNPIELISAQVKGYVATLLNGIPREIIDKVILEEWEKCVHHAEQLQDEDCNRQFAHDLIVRLFIVSLAEDSDDTSSQIGKKKNRSVLCKRWQEQMSHYGLMFLTWFFHLIWDVLAMSARLLVHLFAVMGETGLVWLSWLQVRMTRLMGGDSWWNWWAKKPPPPPKPSEPTLPGGLTANISLPATGDEAMKRLLACKGKDPYRYD
ncbi:protein transport [Homalodisca vitripennis]|nr:protein transport [Homalodisca vitripennis]